MALCHESCLPQFLYLHYPLCQHVCSYCDFNVFSKRRVDEDFSGTWISCISKHLGVLASRERERVALKTIYLGGGTPSLLTVEEISQLMGELSHFFEFSDVQEATMECNPESLTSEKLDAMSALGFTRPSLGVQTFGAAQLKRLERLSTKNHIEQSLKWISDRFQNYTLDLMIGIPDQTPASLEEDLAVIREIRPPHLSVYILTLDDKHKMKTRPSMSQRLVGDDEVSKMYLRVCELLGGLGYLHYEVSNFCLPGYESIHNRNYWNMESSYLGLGPGAHGYLHQNKRIRYSNHLSRHQWVTSEDGVAEREVLDAEQIRLEHAYLSLRTNQGLQPRSASQESVIRALEADGLMEFREDLAFMTERGWLLLDHIAPRVLC